MKRNRTLRYTGMCLGAALIGLVIANAVVTDAQTDEFIRQTDAFIETHEITSSYNKNYNEPETVSLSYTEWQDMESTAVDPDFFEMINGNTMTPEQFRDAGVIFWGMWKFTWYSEKVLPGDGLQIPGRWSDGDFVRDEDGYLCVASNEIPQGEIVDTPFGEAKVYDWIGDGVTGVCDIYVSW